MSDNMSYLILLSSMQKYTNSSAVPFEDSPFLIDSSKVLRGGKMTQKNQARKSMLKHRLSNNSKSSQHSTSNNHSQIDTKQTKFSQFTEKYRGLETIDDDEDIVRFIIYQRVKQSIGSMRGIKLFNRNQNRPKTSVNFKQSCTISQNRSNRTSYSSRSPSKMNTISYEICNALTESKQNSIEYTSDNLNKKMNQYLNLVLKRKGKDQMEIDEKELTIKEMQFDKNKNEQVLTPKRKEFAKGQYKILANNFYRKLKKQFKSSTQSTILSQGSNQLVKSINRQRNYNQQQGYYHPSETISPDRAQEIIRKTTRTCNPSGRSTLRPNSHVFARTQNVSPQRSGKSSFRK